MRLSRQALITAFAILLTAGSTSSAQILKIDEPVLAPIEQMMFCSAYPTECRRHPVTLEFLRRSRRDLYIELDRVNRRINASIRPVTNNRANDSVGRWELMPPVGNCNDFVVSKRHALLRLGWPSSSLLLAAAQLSSGEHHLVLLAILPDDIIVLDNLRDESLSFQTLRNYRWKKISSPTDVTAWLPIL